MRELKTGQVSPVYLLLGEDRGTKEQFLEELAKRVVPEQGDLSVARSVYYGGDVPAGEILSSLRTYAIFTGRKLVIVKELEGIRSFSPFIEYIETPNEESVLVLITDLNRFSQRVIDAVMKKGRACIFWPMFPNEGERWVARKLADFGITADRDAIYYIIELSGTGRSELDSQILNITTYLEEGERLSLGKARNIVSQLHGFTVFDLTGALLIKSKREILTIFHSLLDHGEEPGKLFYFCSREIGRMLHAFALKSAGHDFADIARTLKLRKKEAERFRTLVQRMSLGTFRKLYSDLHALDHTLKSSPRELAMLSFERFIVGLSST
ncbi:MAG: hypothetical protein AMS17_16945 [Spirochaetes bacterium DG_61]|nr:MAG: hypothetical protein AMS17_16945 [Spirochaetes bacterium DG_61]